MIPLQVRVNELTDRYGPLRLEVYNQHLDYLKKIQFYYADAALDTKDEAKRIRFKGFEDAANVAVMVMKNYYVLTTKLQELRDTS